MELKLSVFKRGERPRIRKRADGTKWTQMLKGGWFYRIRYIDMDGKPRSKEHGPFRTKLDAKDAMNVEFRNLEKTHGQSRKGEKLTFDRFAIQCERELFAPAELIDGSWEGGLRSSRSAKSLLKNLRAFFRNRYLNAIMASDLRDYRQHRIKAGVSAATANRELAIMRRMMRYALSEGLVVRDIFKNAKVIIASSEKPRGRILSRYEEARLLAFSEGEHEIEYTRKWKGKEQALKVKTEVGGGYLRALIVIALDTGMRRGELLSLAWRDVDFENGLIRITGAYTKTLESRIAPLSDRAAAELRRLAGGSLKPDERIFAIDDFKRSWATAKRLAKVDDLHFHDLRRTFITRQLASGTSPLIVAKIVGHSQIQTTMKVYTGFDLSMVRESAERLNTANEAAVERGIEQLNGPLN